MPAKIPGIDLSDVLLIRAVVVRLDHGWAAWTVGTAATLYFFDVGVIAYKSNKINVLQCLSQLRN